MKGQSLGDGFQLSDLGTSVHHSVQQIMTKHLLCAGNSLLHDLSHQWKMESLLFPGRHLAAMVHIPEKSACLIKHLFFFFFLRKKRKEKKGSEERKKITGRTSCHFTLQALGKGMRTLDNFHRTLNEMAKSKDPGASSDSKAALCLVNGFSAGRSAAPRV